MRRLRPVELPAALASSNPLPLTAALAQPQAGKPRGGLWLNAAGLAAWQTGQPLHVPTHFAETRALWRTDPRLGIALANATGTAEDGQLYTTEAIALTPGTGFVACIDGDHGTAPAHGLLRLGGDGHGAGICPCDADTPVLPTPDYAALAAAGRFRVLLTTPGLFAGGWRPLPDHGDGRVALGIDPHSATARFACASVSRLETLSGWDLAARRPKPALRAAPTGSVYWFDQFDGDAAALEQLVRDGLPLADPQRAPEGFNRITLAAW